MVMSPHLVLQLAVAFLQPPYGGLLVLEVRRLCAELLQLLLHLAVLLLQLRDATGSFLKQAVGANPNMAFLQVYAGCQ